MIFNMSGGGAALNFKMVGGTTAPSNPSENTIWIDTDVNINSWLFSASEPSEPIDGMIWATYSTSGSSSFNTLKKNGIILCPLKASQYIDGEWINKTAKSYKNGEWTNWTVYVFLKGDQCVDLTGGWKATARNYYGNPAHESLPGPIMPTLTLEDGKMTVSSYHDLDMNYYGGTVETNNKIDMTPYSAVVFNVLDFGILNADPAYGTNYKYRVGVTSNTTSAVYTMDAYVDLTEVGMISVDVSSVNKECAIALNPATVGQAMTTAYITVDDIHFVS